MTKDQFAEQARETLADCPCNYGLSEYVYCGPGVDCTDCWRDAMRQATPEQLAQLGIDETEGGG